MKGLSEMGSRHWLIVSALACIVAFVSLSLYRNRHEIWFANPDQDSAIVLNALYVNADGITNYWDHPSHGSYYVYAGMYRIMEKLHLLDMSNLGQLGASKNPLLPLSEVYYKSRWISILICILCALAFGGIFYGATRKWTWGAAALGLYLIASGGLFFQSLVIRSELVSLWFSLVAFAGIILASRAQDWVRSSLWVGLAGLFFGMAMLTKVQVAPIGLCLLAYLLYACVRTAPSLKPRAYSPAVVAGQILLYLILWAFFSELRDLCHRIPTDVKETTQFQIPWLVYAAFAIAMLGEILSFSAASCSWRLPFFITRLKPFVTGYILSLYVSFFALNFETYGLEASRLCKARTILKLFNPYGSSMQADFSIAIGPSEVLKEFGKHLYHYFLVSGHLSLVVALAAAVVILARRPPSLAAFFSTACGLLLCLVCSLRYFHLYYLCYCDVFFIAAILCLLYQLRSTEWVRFGGIGRSGIFKWGTVVLAIALAVSAFRQYSFVSTKYSRLWWKDQVDKIPAGVCAPSNYQVYMQRAYGSPDAIMRRVCSDPDLNGSKYGIDLRMKPAAQQYLKYFDDAAATSPTLTPEQ